MANIHFYGARSTGKQRLHIVELIHMLLSLIDTEQARAYRERWWYDWRRLEAL